MKSQQNQVRRLLNEAGVISYACAPELIGSIRRMIRNGELAAVLPGVFTAADQVGDFTLRARAVQLRDPAAVLTGSAAAHLHWSTTAPNVLTATGRMRGQHGGISLSRRWIDPEWVVHRNGFPCTAPELTAIDLIPEEGADYVDLLLRNAGSRGAEVLAQMWEAHWAHRDRSGNRLREAILTESRHLPWSEAERRTHTHLRQAGVEGWVTNHCVRAGGRTYYIDIAFPELRLALEIDGFEHHKSRESFERDRRRQNDLVAAGWTVLRVTWAMLQDAAWLAWLRASMATSAGGL